MDSGILKCSSKKLSIFERHYDKQKTLGRTKGDYVMVLSLQNSLDKEGRKRMEETTERGLKSFLCKIAFT